MIEFEFVVCYRWFKKFWFRLVYKVRNLIYFGYAYADEMVGKTNLVLLCVDDPPQAGEFKCLVGLQFFQFGGGEDVNLELSLPHRTSNFWITTNTSALEGRVRKCNLHVLPNHPSNPPLRLRLLRHEPKPTQRLPHAAPSGAKRSEVHF